MQPLEVLCEPWQNPVLEIAAVTDLGQDWDVDGELDDVMEWGLVSSGVAVVFGLCKRLSSS